jgi:hypothetical protein
MDVYCPKCETPVASFNFSGKNVSQVEPLDEEQTVVRPVQKIMTPSASGPALRPWMMASIGGLIVLLIISLVVLATVISYSRMTAAVNADSNTSSHNGAVPPTASPTPTETPTPTPTPMPKVQIVDSKIPVSAGQSESVAFTLDARSRITGGYVVSDGEQIDVQLIDGASHVYYGRPASPKDKINIVLPAGNYQMIFGNKHAWFTSKTVAVQLFYQQL